MLPKVRMLGKGLLDVFMPRSCVHCGGGVEGPTYEFLCGDCAGEIFPCLPPACKICGYPFFGQLAGPQACPHCSELNPVFDEGKTLFLAKGPARSLIHDLKYSAGFYVLRDLAKMVAATPHYRNYLLNSILVPVPLHPTKLRERGYNQSEQLAQMLSRESGSPVAKLLHRIVFTQTQTRLNRTERHRNVKNAFALTPDAVLIPDLQYILVDDVFTTGSTLNACAHVLRSAGATRLKVVTLGHG